MVHLPQDQIPEKLSEASLQRRRESAHRRHGQFIKGPIPAWWVKRAATLPGKALAVGMAIWFMRGVTEELKGIAVTGKLIAGYGVKRKAGYHALKVLEANGLILVDRQRGRSPRVTLRLAVESKAQTPPTPAHGPRRRTSETQEAARPAAELLGSEAGV